MTGEIKLRHNGRWPPCHFNTGEYYQHTLYSNCRFLCPTPPRRVCRNLYRKEFPRTNRSANTSLSKTTIRWISNETMLSLLQRSYHLNSLSTGKSELWTKQRCPTSQNWFKRTSIGFGNSRFKANQTNMSSCTRIAIKVPYYGSGTSRSLAMSN